MDALAEIYQRLSEPVPDNLIQLKEVEYKKNGQKKTFTLDVVSWYDTADLMDKRAPGWEMEVSDPVITKDYLMVKVKVTVHGSDGSASRENTGIEELSSSNFYGDVLSNAVAMSFKRACAMHGLGRHMWRNEDKYKQKGKRSSGDGASTAPPKLRKVEKTTATNDSTPDGQDADKFEKMKKWVDDRIFAGDTIESILTTCKEKAVPKFKTPKYRTIATEWIKNEWEVAG